jgi:hypothetical protein
MPFTTPVAEPIVAIAVLALLQTPPGRVSERVTEPEPPQRSDGPEMIPPEVAGTQFGVKTICPPESFEVR